MKKATIREAGIRCGSKLIDRYYYYLHFTKQKPRSLRPRNLPKSHNINSRAGIPRQLRLQSQYI